MLFHKNELRVINCCVFIEVSKFYLISFCTPVPKQKMAYQINTRGNNVSVNVVEGNTNLAIKGLFKHLTAAEIAAAEADGYKQTPWAIGMYVKNGLEDADREAEWSSKFMGGYTDAEYAAKKAPIYLIPMEHTVCVTTGLSNGYGFTAQ